MPKYYNKLIRDNIPEIIAASGKTCITEVMDDEEYFSKLNDKLNEEVAEYQEDKSVEELADILEVIRAIVKAEGYSWEQLEEIRKAKEKKNGGFEKKLLLKEVSD